MECCSVFCLTVECLPEIVAQSWSVVLILFDCGVCLRWLQSHGVLFCFLFDCECLPAESAAANAHTLGINAHTLGVFVLQTHRRW